MTLAEIAEHIDRGSQIALGFAIGWIIRRVAIAVIRTRRAFRKTEQHEEKTP